MGRVRRKSPKYFMKFFFCALRLSRNKNGEWKEFMLEKLCKFRSLTAPPRTIKLISQLNFLAGEKGKDRNRIAWKWSYARVQYSVILQWFIIMYCNSLRHQPYSATRQLVAAFLVKLFSIRGCRALQIFFFYCCKYLKLIWNSLSHVLFICARREAPQSIQQAFHILDSWRMFVSSVLSEWKLQYESKGRKGQKSFKKLKFYYPLWHRLSPTK